MCTCCVPGNSCPGLLERCQARSLLAVALHARDGALNIQGSVGTSVVVRCALMCSCKRRQSQRSISDLKAFCKYEYIVKELLWKLSFLQQPEVIVPHYCSTPHLCPHHCGSRSCKGRVVLLLLSMTGASNGSL